MAIYRNIQISFWTDPNVTDEFTPEDKYFYLYLITNPHTNLCGCYEVSKKQVSWETGYSSDTIDRLIHRFEAVHHVIQFNAETKELLLLNWYKYNWTTSEKFRKPLQKEIESIKCERFKEYLTKAFEGDTVSIPYQYGMDTTVTDTVTVTDTNTVLVTRESQYIEKGKRFKAPTLEEVQEYCDERGNNIDPQAFIDFYEAKGWMVGKNKMKDWRACVRTWEGRRQLGSGRSVRAVQPSDYIVDQINGVEYQGKKASKETLDKLREAREKYL